MRNLIGARLATLATTLVPSPTARTTREARRIVVDAIERGGHNELWLVLAVLHAALPTPREVTDLQRAVITRGAPAAVGEVVRRARWSTLRRSRRVAVTVAVDQDLVDVHHTARTSLATGIQRVARMTLREWVEAHSVATVGWSRDLSAMRSLTPGEQLNALYGSQPHAHERSQREVIIPWRSRYILLELAIEAVRVERIAALAEFSGNTCVALGFDCVPLTTSETTGAGMGTAFAHNLAALAHFDAVTTISEAAAREYGGWKQMLSGVGLPGPSITSVLLPSEAGVVEQGEIDSARRSLGLNDTPVVLCVGSHEPRKNHGAVVHAADIVWRRGVDFQLLFIGGNAWGERAAHLEMEALVEAGRPLTLVSKPSDDLLWSAYALATVTIFPSLNEGFGLPVAESLAMGTPVITSNFGSMAEIAAQGGCVLVDPRDDEAIADAIEAMVTRPAERERLSSEARARNNSRWSEYARTLWDSFHASR